MPPLGETRGFCVPVLVVALCEALVLSVVVEVVLVEAAGGSEETETVCVPEPQPARRAAARSVPAAIVVLRIGPG
jgi:hypothetical protein